MAIESGGPAVRGLREALGALREWQDDEAPFQLHPGDLGWFWRFGAEVTAAAVRTWHRGDRILAVGLLDGPGLLRLTMAPEVRQDLGLARRLVADLAAVEGGVLPAGRASVEAPPGVLLRELLLGAGWRPGEPWTPLVRDLAEPVESVGRPGVLGTGLRVRMAGPAEAGLRAAVQRAAFDGSRFTAEHWRSMAAGPGYADARCLLGYDERGVAVATATVWSAGAGRPGLLEPLGVHREHRGCGYGRAISLAAAAALRRLGSSSALVCTPSANAGAVATYRAAGFRPLPERLDISRGD